MALGIKAISFFMILISYFKTTEANANSICNAMNSTEYFRDGKYNFLKGYQCSDDFTSFRVCGWDMYRSSYKYRRTIQGRRCNFGTRCRCNAKDSICKMNSKRDIMSICKPFAHPKLPEQATFKFQMDAVEISNNEYGAESLSGELIQDMKNGHCKRDWKKSETESNDAMKYFYYSIQVRKGLYRKYLGNYEERKCSQWESSEPCKYHMAFNTRKYGLKALYTNTKNETVQFWSNQFTKQSWRFVLNDSGMALSVKHHKEGGKKDKDVSFSGQDYRYDIIPFSSSEAKEEFKVPDFCPTAEK